MSTFLELCQKTASESGTIAGTLPAAVASQSGRLLKIVNWTAAAWVSVQNLHNAWRFMRAEYTGTITQGTSRYTAASFSLTDHAAWLRDIESEAENYLPHSLYLTATGVSDEGAIAEISWQKWRERYGRGTQDQNRPIEYAISPALEFCLGPVPDAAYTLKGEYRKTAEVLALDADVPDCPARFHDIIVWRAVMLLAEHDEAPLAVAAQCRLKYLEILESLQRDQLPMIELGGAALA